MECRRMNPHSSLSTSPSHTHTYTNAIPLDSWSISNPTGHPVLSQAQSGIHPQSHWSPCAFTGMHLQSHWAPCAFTGMYPHTNPQSRCPPQPFSPIPGPMFLYYISYKRQHGSACVSPGAGFNPPEFLLPCGLPVSCCLATSVVRSLSTGCPLRARRGPRGLPPPRIFMFLGGMKAAFVLSPSPGPWRAPRLDSADVDSRVWLISTWTYIAFAVPFMV